MDGTHGGGCRIEEGEGRLHNKAACGGIACQGDNDPSTPPLRWNLTSEINLDNDLIKTDNSAELFHKYNYRSKTGQMPNGVANYVADSHPRKKDTMSWRKRWTVT